MSKEIAQTVGGKRIAWLIAIVAAFAVFATVSLQNDTARADATIVCGTVDADPPTGATTTVPVGDTIYCQATTLAAVTGGIDWGTTGTASVTVTGDGVATTVATAPTTNASFLVTGAGSFQVTVAYNDANGNHGAAEAGQTTAAFTAVGVTATTPTVAAGQNATTTIVIPAGLTYCSDATGVTGDARTGGTTATDFAVTGLTVVTNTPTTALDNVDGTHTVVVSDDATAGGPITVYTHLADSDVADDCTATASTVAAGVFAVPELRHIPDGVAANTSTVIARQEINSNVRGSRHTVCLVAQNTGIDNNDADVLANNPVATPVLIPGITLANIAITNGGGYLTTPDTEPDFTDVRIFEGDGTALGTNANSGLDGATCISWVSTDAGDQQINIVYVGANGLQYNASWDTDNDGNGAPANGQTVGVNRAPIKE